MANELTHWGLVRSYGTWDFVNIGPSNGLVPLGTKPLPEPMLTHHQWQSLIYISVNIGSGNGLLPDSTKPLPEPVLTSH